MSLHHNSSIVTNGLVLYTDMSNTQKSWKGQPATNTIPSAAAMPSWSAYYRTTSAVTFTTEMGTTGYRMLNQPSWNGVYRAVTIPSTGTYTFSAWVRYLGGSSANNGGTVYISGWGGGDSAVGLDKSKVGVWQRISITLNCTTTSMTFYLISYGGTDNGTTSPDYSSWEVTMPQVEAGSYVTPFVDGTRSNTQAIVDLTNNNTLTATSLTYASDGTFSFNGSSNQVDVATNLGVMSAYTISFWARRDAENRMPIGWRGGPTFYWYGDNSWYYTHGGVGGEYYYAKPTSIPLGTWGHYSVVYNGANVSIYRQGVLQGSQATTGTADWTNGVRIGYWAGGAAYYWQGRIDAVSMYNRALTASEVSQNFNALRGRYSL